MSEGPASGNYCHWGTLLLATAKYFWPLATNSQDADKLVSTEGRAGSTTGRPCGPRATYSGPWPCQTGPGPHNLWPGPWPSGGRAGPALGPWGPGPTRGQCICHTPPELCTEFHQCALKCWDEM